MNKVLAVILIFIVLFKLDAQVTQVSHINNIQTIDTVPFKGFALINDSIYYIETGLENTAISIVENFSKISVHNITDRPSDSDFYLHNEQIRQAKYSMAIEDHFYYEIFSHYINQVNIVTGESTMIYDGSQLSPPIEYEVEINEGSLYFYQGNIHYRYDISNQVLAEVPMIDGTNQLKVGDKIIAISNQVNSIIEYDLTTGKYDTLAQSNSGQWNYDSDMENSRGTQYQFYNTVTGQILFYSQNNLHLEIDCVPVKDNSKYYLLDNLILEYRVTGGYYSLIVHNATSCQEVTIFPEVFNYVEGSTDFKVDFIYHEDLDNQHIILQQEGNWLSNANLYIFDAENIELIDINLPISTISLDQFAKEDNSIIAVAYNEVHYLGVEQILTSINIETGECTTHDTTVYRSSHLPYYKFSSKIQNGLFYYYKNSKEHQYLAAINIGQEGKEIVEEYDYAKNVGIQEFTPRLGLWHDENMIYTANENIYKTTFDSTQTILDSLKVHSCVVNDQEIIALVSNEDSVQIYSYDLVSNDYYLSTIEYLSYVLYEPHTLNNLILYTPVSSDPFLHGYVDPIDKKFKGYFIDENRMAVQEYVFNDNNMLIKINGQRYLFDAISKELDYIGTINSIYKNLYPIHGDHFIGTSNDESHPILIIPPDGIPYNHSENIAGNHIVNGSRKTPNSRITAILKNDTINVIYSKDNKISIKNLIDHNANFYTEFNWHMSDHGVVHEVQRDEEHFAYYYSFEKEPILLTTYDDNKDLTSAIILEDRILLFITELNNHELIIYEYDINNENLEFRTSIEVAPNTNIEHLGPISDAFHLFSIRDPFVGNELWNYNIATGEISIFQDINVGTLGSYPDDLRYSPSKETVFFTAINEGGERQVFRIDEPSITLIADKKNTKKSINIWPNPTSESIYLNNDYHHIRIIDRKGAIISNIYHYNKLDPIFLHSLSSGTYYIKAVDLSGNSSTSKFVYISSN